jgi:uncharacterized membrane protein
MTAVTFLTIRATHILVAALWIGSTVFSATLLMPAVDAAGAAGGQLMARLQRRGLPIYMEVIGVTTVLSGLYLLWHFTGGFDPSVSVSHSGLAFGIGGVAGVLAGLIGGAVVGRSAKRLSQLSSGAVTIADDHVHRALLAEITSLKRRMRIGSRVVIGLQTTALVFMSVGHYV